MSVNDDSSSNVYFDFSKNFLPAGDYVLTVKVNWLAVDVKDYTVAIHTGKDQITITETTTGKPSNAMKAAETVTAPVYYVSPDAKYTADVFTPTGVLSTDVEAASKTKKSFYGSNNNLSTSLIYYNKTV